PERLRPARSVPPVRRVAHQCARRGRPGLRAQCHRRARYRALSRRWRQFGSRLRLPHARTDDQRRHRRRPRPAHRQRRGGASVDRPPARTPRRGLRRCRQRRRPLAGDASCIRLRRRPALPQPGGTAAHRPCLRPGRAPVARARERRRRLLSAMQADPPDAAAAPAPAPAPVPTPAAGAPTPRRRAHRPLRWAASFVVAVVVVAAALVGALIWALHDASGSAWLLGHVPRLKVTAPRGSLLGDFAAGRRDIVLPGSAGTIRLDQPRWHALAASPGDHGRWLRLTIDTLHVDRVTILPAVRSPATPATPMSPPTSLRLPVEIVIREASVDTLRFGGSADAPEVTAVHGRIHLGAVGGAS